LPALEAFELPDVGLDARVLELAHRRHHEGRAQRAIVGRGVVPHLRELRPDLVVRTIAELQDAGVEPDIWKIEGLETRMDCERVVAQARTGGRDDVTCIVLGRGAGLDRVAHWLREAAPVEGYIGFAVGRTIWLDALTEHLAGRLARDAAVARIAANHRRMIDVYAGAADAVPQRDAARAAGGPA
jgi:myo-inositol catabolism protein IolC